LIVIDANVLLYAHDSSDARHPPAARWLEAAIGGTEAVGLALTTVLAFIRIATDPRVYTIPIDASQAIDLVESWLRRANVQLIGPTDAHWRTLTDLAVAGQARGPVLMDAHLAALTLEHGATLATTDRDFARFPGLRTIDPTADRGAPTGG
jgi:toxin-antitoxin system PIN domain toxin